MKKTKFFLPIAAVVFSVIGALATGATIINDPVVIDGDDECTQIGRCSNNMPGSPCRNSQLQQLDVKQSDLSCSVPATGTFTPNP